MAAPHISSPKAVGLGEPEAKNAAHVEIANKQQPREKKVEEAKKGKMGIHRCPTCQTFNTSYTVIQLRTDDELMRVRVTCDEPNCLQPPWNV